MTEMQMYWLITLDSISSSLITITVILGFISVIIFICWFMCDPKAYNDTEKLVYVRSKKIVKWIIPIFIIFLLTSTFTPNTKQMAAVKVVPKIINGIEKSKIPEQLNDLAKEWIKELTPKKESKK